MEFDSPFKDACSKTVPTGSAVPEPNLPAGMPERTGGLLPEKCRDTAVTPKSPEWISPERQSFKFGTPD